MDISPREPVILAADFAALVAWYRDALGFSVERLYEDTYHYCNLKSELGMKLGIASAQEMGVDPGDRSKNTVVLQFEVDDVKAFFEHLGRVGGTVASGPSFNAADSFWFGSFSDPEGNPFWVVDRNCPNGSLDS